MATETEPEEGRHFLSGKTSFPAIRNGRESLDGEITGRERFSL